MKNLKSLEILTTYFAKLPGVGLKSAERMAYAILDLPSEDVTDFANALNNAKANIHKCPKCGIYTEDEECEICANKDRNSNTLIVVSYSKDALAFEKLNNFDGRYHILNGVISATSGQSIEDLNIDSLLKRIKEENVKEIILATNPTLEGETTALYIAKLLENKDVIVTRLAYGLPMGGHLDYADSLTLNRALEGRRKI